MGETRLLLLEETGPFTPPKLCVGLTENGINPIPRSASVSPVETKVVGALVTATTDKSWAARAAALEAIAQREDRSLVASIAPAFDDPRDAVRFSAAGCIAPLSDNPSANDRHKSAKP